MSAAVLPVALPLPSHPRLPDTLIPVIDALGDVNTATKTLPLLVILHVAYCASPTPAEASVPPHDCVYDRYDDEPLDVEIVSWLPPSYMSPPPSLMLVPLVPSENAYKLLSAVVSHAVIVQLKSADSGPPLGGVGGGGNDGGGGTGGGGDGGKGGGDGGEGGDGGDGGGGGTATQS
jgi:hypothetical protein